MEPTCNKKCKDGHNCTRSVPTKPDNCWQHIDYKAKFEIWYKNNRPLSVSYGKFSSWNVTTLSLAPHEGTLELTANMIRDMPNLKDVILLSNKPSEEHINHLQNLANELPDINFYYGRYKTNAVQLTPMKSGKFTKSALKN